MLKFKMVEIKEVQDKVKEFDVARGWGEDWNVKDLLLNITEEGGELWDLVKWIDEDKQKEVVAENKAEASDYVGDVLALVWPHAAYPLRRELKFDFHRAKLANQMGVDAEGALNQTLSDYEKRMPADVMKKVGHANKLAGGVDDKGALE